MKALTIWQPWASLLVSGQKKYETRSWATAYRGPIAIHAAMRPVRRTIDALAADKEGSGWNVLERLDGLFIRPGALDQLPTGAIVGKAILTRCNLITEDFRAKATGGRVQVGDVVYRKPVSFSDSDAKNAQTMRVAVVWVHPAGRFHVVEFEKGVRESFEGVQR